MPRIGISYEQVAAAADGLVADNISPTMKSVRERLGGTGSGNTIHKHLSAWRSTRPLLSATSIELPSTILLAICQEIDRARAESRSEIEDRLVISQAEAAELAATGESLEADLDNLTEELGAMSTDRDVMLRKFQEQASEIERLSRENERERYAAEQARTEVAQIRNRIDIQEERLAEQSATIVSLTAAHAAEAQAKVISERAVAVLDAKLQAERDKTSGLVLEKEALVAQMAADRQSAIAQVAMERQSASVQVDAERQSAETARIQAARITSELELQAVSLAEIISTNKELTGFYESERKALGAAEKQIAVLQTKLEEQGRAVIHSLQSPKSEISTDSKMIVTPAGNAAAVSVI